MNDLVEHEVSITKHRRQEIHKQRSCVLWFTGYSGAGKSTLANAVEVALAEQHKAKTYLLDGDNVRLGLCSDLTFSDTDRHENIRRIGEVCHFFVDAGVIVLSAFISPFTKDRLMARNMVEAEEFIEIFVDVPLEVCEERDIKGLYKKARQGKIKKFTGIDSPYEPPQSPEIRIDQSHTVGDAVAIIIEHLQKNNYLAS